MHQVGHLPRLGCILVLQVDLPLNTIIDVTALFTIVPFGVVKLTLKLRYVFLLYKDSARTAQ